MAIRLGPKNTTTCIVVSREHLKLLRGAASHAKKIDPHMSVSSVIGNLIERNRAHLEALASVDNRAPRAATTREEAISRFRAEPHHDAAREVVSALTLSFLVLSRNGAAAHPNKFAT
jgi:hypothetical protein